ncbi:RPS3 (mitochondrion) [Zygosaccharomyces parabailii]|nr:RPS3 [Zygosaccharomyces parabailii]
MNVNLLKLLNKLQDSNNKNNMGLSLNSSTGTNYTFPAGSNHPTGVVNAFKEKGGEINKELLLKYLLLELNKLRLNKNINILAPEGGYARDINKYIKELSNKGNKLQHLNTMNTWSTQIYNYNNNNEIMTFMKDMVIRKLLYKLMTYKLDLNNNKIIIISKPIFEHSLNKLNIKFYYYNKSSYIHNNNNKLYYMNMLSRIINLLNNDSNNLSRILSYYYNKNVTIEPIKLSYNYLNSDIFSKSISLDNINKGIKNEYSRTLNNNLPKLNDKNISMNYINNIKLINKFKYNNIINNINNNNKLNINNIYKDINIINLPMNILMFKYLTGWSVTYNGRLSANKSISRSETHKLLVGTFRNKNYLWSNMNNLYKLNYISANHNLSSNHNINKNGTYNIKVKLNFI